MKYNFLIKQNSQLTQALKSNLPQLKRGREKSLILNREVKVNGKRVESDILLDFGDEVEVFVPDAYLDKTAVKIIYSDQNIVIADKPARTDSETDLPALLESAFGQLMPAHRLDTNTTGLIILARNSFALDSLTEAFRNKTIKKVYLAEVCGSFKQKSGTIKNWLVKHAANGSVSVYDKSVPGGMEAITNYEVTENRSDTSIVRLMPQTGRTHQLRAQLAHIGHPILGDGKYGNFEINRTHNAKMQSLRAVSLKLGGLAAPLEQLNGKIFNTEDFYE